MIKNVAHIGLTVNDMDESIKFYRDVLGLKFEGELIMEGKETDLLFRKENCKVRVAYLNGGDQTNCPPVELIYFVSPKSNDDRADLLKTSISELCFYTDDIDKTYQHLVSHGVECLSSPQMFDFTAAGFGKSKAIYFKDNNGIILELMQIIK